MSRQPSSPLEPIHEADYGIRVCGVDEVGRGPLAGPVYAAAVILPPMDHIPATIKLADSKALSKDERSASAAWLHSHATCAIGIASVAEIDQINILRAALLAMERAVAKLVPAPDYALIDGNHLPAKLPCPGLAVIKGDARSTSIAAASIIAKVARDDAMAELAQDYPAYGFERHAGYGTKAHKQALLEHGITPHHRRSFAPIRALIEAADVAEPA